VAERSSGDVKSAVRHFMLSPEQQTGLEMGVQLIAGDECWCSLRRNMTQAQKNSQPPVGTVAEQGK